MLENLAQRLGFGGGVASILADCLGGHCKVVALDNAIGKALTAAGHDVVLAKYQAGRIEPASEADAVCVSIEGSEIGPRLDELTAEVLTLRKGGRLLAATSRRGLQPHTVAALLLHAGLCDIRQRVVRNVLVTEGVREH